MIAQTVCLLIGENQIEWILNKPSLKDWHVRPYNLMAVTAASAGQACSHYAKQYLNY